MYASQAVFLHPVMRRFPPGWRQVKLAQLRTPPVSPYRQVSATAPLSGRIVGYISRNEWRASQLSRLSLGYR
jgi:hypothetical protein